MNLLNLYSVVLTSKYWFLEFMARISISCSFMIEIIITIIILNNNNNEKTENLWVSGVLWG